MHVITSIEQALELVGEELGVTEWTDIDQKRIDEFADITNDHQWIHVDTERAARESQYGSTIAHGFLTLSMLPGLSKGNYRVDGKMGINYGLNKVRFLAPVRSGSRVRIRSELVDATRVADDTLNLTVRHTVELEGGQRPALVADLISRYIF